MILTPATTCSTRVGSVTFLDFGLVKRFTDQEMATFVGMVKSAAFDHDDATFRRVVEDAGMLRRGAPRRRRGDR